jgi:hypothetical protein
MQAASPAPSCTSAIPFAQPGASAAPDGGGTFLLTALLLGLAIGVLWLLRKRLLNPPAVTAGSTPAGAIAVAQRIRVSATCMATVLEGEGARVLVVESRQGLQVVPWPGGVRDDA